MSPSCISGDPDVSCGDRLRIARRKLGLSQPQMAAEIGVSQSFVAAIESGRNDLSRALLRKLIARFGISADWLLTGHGRAFIHHQTETRA